MIPIKGKGSHCLSLLDQLHLWGPTLWNSYHTLENHSRSPCHGLPETVALPSLGKSPKDWFSFRCCGIVLWHWLALFEELFVVLGIFCGVIRAWGDVLLLETACLEKITSRTNFLAQHHQLNNFRLLALCVCNFFLSVKCTDESIIVSWE